MAITKDQVQHIAKLVKLNLPAKELEKYALLFSDTLDYIQMLTEIDTAQVAPTYQVTGLSAIFMQDDESRNMLTQEEALSNAAKIVDGKIATEAVFER